MTRVSRFALAIALFACACRERALTPATQPSPFHAADALYQGGRYQDAANAYGSLRDAFSRKSDQENEWRARLWWTRSMHLLGKNTVIEPELGRLRAMAGDNQARLGWVHCTIGIVRARQGRFDEGLAEARAGLAISRQLRDDSLASICYDAIITALSNRGHYRESLAASQERVAIERARSAPPLEMADALNDIGVDYRHLGRFDEAIRVYEEALRIYQGVQNLEGKTKVLYNLANVHAALGDFDRELELKSQSLRSARQMGHAWGLGLLHTDLGGIYARNGQIDRARSHLRSALEIGRSASLPAIQAQALMGLGRTETAARRFLEARDALAESMSIADSNGLLAERATSRAAAARNAAAAGSKADALRWADQAVAIAEDLDDPEIEFEALEARAVALEAAGDSKAGNAYMEAIDLLESMRGRLALGDLRMGVAQRRLSAYEGAIRVLLSRGEEEEAFDVAERARARVLMALMAQQEEHRSARSEEGRIRQSLRERYEARKSVQRPLRRTLDRQIADLTRQLTVAEARSLLSDPARSRLRNPRPARCGEIRAGLLRNDSALLSFFWGDKAVYAWWIDREGVRAAEIADPYALAASAAFLRELVQDETARGWKPPARYLYSRLIEPLSPSKKQRMFVVPDGPLSYLPFEVLIPGERPAPWGATAEFIYSPSASVLLALENHPRSRRHDRSLLAVGDPDSKPWLLASLGSQSRDERTSLPYASEEVRAISRLYRAAGADSLLGSRATLHNWIGFQPKRYRYLHFATHAEIDDRRPAKTALSLSGRDLELADVRAMSFDAELVTLSACNTALGPQVRGEGIIGLPHAFLASGAAGVLVTLWRVPDRSSSEFMREFYREMKNGKPPATALRDVRRRWISQPPSRWAPFILVGQGK